MPQSVIGNQLLDQRISDTKDTDLSIIYKHNFTRDSSCPKSDCNESDTIFSFYKCITFLY